MSKKIYKGRVKRIRTSLGWALIASGIVLLLVIAFVIYCESYYHADEQALMTAINYKDVTVRSITDKSTAYYTEGSTVGIIFYPGAKVEAEAYAPLMCECAGRGITCVLVHMPGNMAFLGKDGADGVQDIFPEVETWYMAGHSLGGVMAADYAAEHAGAFEGVILLGAYADTDISGLELRALSVRGSEDRIVRDSKYDECRALLPTDAEEKVIEGGCHSYFGMYGLQKGDGTPTLTVEEQLAQTADIISDFVLEK